MSKTNGQADVSLDDSIKVGPAKVEPIKVETAKTETSKTEPMQTKDEQLKNAQLKNEDQKQILENELPIEDPIDGFTEKHAFGNPQGTAASAESELQKLRSERDDLFDRLARL